VVILLLPVLDLGDDIVAEVVPDLGVQVAEAVGLDEDALAGRLRGAVLRALLDQVVPFLGPGLQAARVVPLDLSALLDQRDQVARQLVAILDALGRPLVVVRLPERVARRDQHVVVTVVRHL
jgi:hypothetical protein